MNRAPVTTAEELDAFDQDEVIEGYMDGLRDPIHEPGDNRSKAYWHGWRNGSNDAQKTVDGPQRELIRDLKSKGRVGPRYQA
jgi:hypothetical protein